MQLKLQFCSKIQDYISQETIVIKFIDKIFQDPGSKNITSFLILAKLFDCWNVFTHKDQITSNLMLV